MSHIPICPDPAITLYESDAVVALNQLQSGIADLFLTSTQYFNKCDYKHPDQYGLEPTIDQYLEVQAKVFDAAYRVAKEGAILIVNLDDSQNNYSPVRGKGDKRVHGEWVKRREIQKKWREKSALLVPLRLSDRLREIGWHPIPTLYWDKVTTATVDFMGANDCEPILMFLKQSTGRRLKPNYLIPFKSRILRHVITSDPVHPCPYPVSLAQELIEHCCLPGGLVIDPFVGSGSTAIAARNIGRQCIGIDLDCKRAIERLSEPYQSLLAV